MKPDNQDRVTGISHKEELANWLTHGIAILLSVAGAIWIFWSLVHLPQASVVKWISVSVYLSGMILLYSASTLYHYVNNPRWKHVLRIIDHSAIYVKIAGTYTPFLVLAIPYVYGYGLLTLLWVMALAGILFKVFFVNRYNTISTVIYLCMGWIAVLILLPLYNALALDAFIFILAGGFSFSLGVIFYLMKKLPYAHSIWHLFVMGGSAFHYASVYLFVVQ